MTKATAETSSKRQKTRIAIICAAIIVVLAGGTLALALLVPQKDYVQACLDDQANGRMTDTSMTHNCEKALEAERLKDCGGSVERCRDTLERN